jgi:Tfp pilus assembly PilM family ATPase
MGVGKRGAAKMAPGERHLMLDVITMKLRRRERLMSVLGLALDGGRLDGVVLRRTNGAMAAQQPLSASLSLDLLTNDPELVGREIRNQLDAAEVRERNCAVGLPLKWALTTHVELPALPEEDIVSFLQIEAERGFPCDTSTLHVVVSRCRAASGKQHALLVGIPKNHLELLERVLRVSKLRPVSFSLGITALQPPKPDAEGVLALAIGQTQVDLQVTVGGGIFALRALEGALELEGSRRVLQVDAIAREVRITLGQLPAELRDGIRAIRVFGPRELAQELADELELRLEATGLKAEPVQRYEGAEFGLPLTGDVSVSPACSLGAARLAGRPNEFEFLPPRVTPWQQVMAKYSSGKLRAAITAAGAVGLLVGGLFFYQQCQLWRYEAQWAKISKAVSDLEGIQRQVNIYRPWYDETVRGLTILRSLTQAFPEDGSVTAKTVEIRDLNQVICTGTARNYQALLQTVQRLRGIPQVRDANLGPTRGQSPALQFSFSFAWNEGVRNAN